MRMRRTDLAMEARELWQERTGEMSALSGVEAHDSLREGIPVNTVRVLDQRGEEALGKPRGSYVTLTLEGLANREEGVFRRSVQAAAAELAGLIQDIPPEGLVLVAGLGPMPWAPRSTRTFWSPGIWCVRCRSTSALCGRLPLWRRR